MNLESSIKKRKRNNFEQDMEKRWIEVKPFPDFNSQLRGMDKKQKCRKSWMAYKVNTDIAPECYLDKFIERGHFKEAATVSDKENLQLDFRLCEILR